MAISLFLGFLLHCSFLTKAELLEALNQVIYLLNCISQVPQIGTWHAHSEAKSQDKLLYSKSSLSIDFNLHFSLQGAL